MDWVRTIDRSPRWMRRSVMAIAQGRTPLGGAVDRLLHRDVADDGPELPDARSAPRRVLIGPANEAEQGYQWAHAFSRIPGVDAVSFMGFDPGGYQVASDLTVEQAVYLRSRRWHDRFEAWLLRRTHVVWESGLPLLGRRYGFDAYAEIERFRAAGIRAAVMFHGTDIRPPAAHLRDHARSPFADPEVPARLIGDRAARNARRAAELGITTFVSTPDLLRYVPGAVWCPTVVEPARWGGAPAAFRDPDRVPLVVHAPSSPRIKGTLHVEPVLRRLEAEGVIRYRQIVGVPHARIPEAYAEADIVLDQFLLGGYGVAAIEALAAGRLVIGHVDAETRDEVRNHTGLDVPILEADVESVERVLREAVSDPDVTSALRAAGPGFVTEVHDGRFSARQAGPYLGVSD